MKETISLSKAWYDRCAQVLHEFSYLPLINEKVYVEIFEHVVILKKNKI